MDEEEIARMAAEGNTNTPETPAPPPAPDYAKLYADAQAQMAIQTQQVNQLIQQQQALMQNTAQPAQQPVLPIADPFEKFDPETAKALKAFTDNLKQTFNQELAQRDQRLAELQTSHAFTQIAASAGPVASPAIIKRAQELYVGLSKKGLPVNADDMYNFAIGEAVRNGTYQPGARTNQPAVLTGGSRQPQRSNRPANFDSMPYREQVKVLEANGELDAEF